jgi:pseudouridine-5'-phosphate glycosidase
VEDIVRGHGVVPASIGIIDGLIHVGLTSSQLERLAVPDQKRIKVSKRDIPYVLSNVSQMLLYFSCDCRINCN